MVGVFKLTESFLFEIIMRKQDKTEEVRCHYEGNL